MSHPPLPPYLRAILTMVPKLRGWGKDVDQSTIVAAEIADCLYGILDNKPHALSQTDFVRVTRDALLATSAERFEKLAEQLQDLKAAAELAIAAIDAVTKASRERKLAESQEQRTSRTYPVTFGLPATMN